MKKYFIYILPVLLVTLAACNELDKYPLDSVSSEVYFKNASQLEQYSNQFYTILPGADAMYNEPSDEISISELADEVRGTRLIPTDASGTNWNWSMLRRINYLLEHIDQCADVTAREQYRGLALFFRAYLYYDRVRHYGDVPWIDHTVGNNEVQEYARRVSRDTIMHHVIEDLDNAYLLLSDDKSNVYRVNCWTAMALKSRACLFEGTFCKYHPELYKVADQKAYYEEMLKQAADAAKLVMENGGYTIYKGSSDTTAYRELFTQGKVQGIPEYIMARCYSAAIKQTHNVNYFTMVSTAGHPGFTKRFVNKYLCRDGSRFTDKTDYQKIGMGEEMTDRDPRMEQTILRPGHYVRIGEAAVSDYNFTNSSTGYQLIKYVMGKEYDTYTNSDCDMPLFRYAEVLLNYAEAKAELGESGEDVENAINQLRDRVGMAHLSATAANETPCAYMESLYPNVDQGGNKGLILEIRRERDIELVQEGLRYWDVMRWKAGKAFEEPFYGLAFAGVSQGEHDMSGCVDVDGDGRPEICVYYKVKPRIRAVGCEMVELRKGIWLSNDSLGGNIICNGNYENQNGGRQWIENRDYLYPVPTRERVLSEGKITQNPNWVDNYSN